MRTLPVLLALLVTLGSAHAQEGRRVNERAAEAAAHAEDGGRESIADEAAEVGADDDEGLGRDADDRSAGGMSTVEDEMVDSADDDGCTGSMGLNCDAGDN